MEGIIIFIIIGVAASYLCYQKLSAHKRAKCSDCAETSCTSCPIATMPTLKAHLETRKTPTHTE